MAEDTWKELRKLAATGAHAAELSNWMAGLDAPYGVDETWRDEIGQRTAEFWHWVREDLGRAALDRPPVRTGAWATAPWSMG